MRLEFSNLFDSRTFLLYYNKYRLPEKAFIVGAVHFLNITNNQEHKSYDCLHDVYNFASASEALSVSRTEVQAYKTCCDVAEIYDKKSMNISKRVNVKIGAFAMQIKFG